MPVFLHQNELHEATEKMEHLRISLSSNKSALLPRMEIKQVVKDIFESSIVGGKARHEKMKNFLGKDPAISESLIHENTRVGSLFASKAFVQLIVNPIVGIATEEVGYQIPFLFGTVILFLSSLGRYNFWTQLISQ